MGPHIDCLYSFFCKLNIYIHLYKYENGNLCSTCPCRFGVLDMSVTLWCWWKVVLNWPKNREIVGKNSLYSGTMGWVIINSNSLCVIFKIELCTYSRLWSTSPVKTSHFTVRTCRPIGPRKHVIDSASATLFHEDLDGFGVGSVHARHRCGGSCCGAVLECLLDGTLSHGRCTADTALGLTDVQIIFFWSLNFQLTETTFIVFGRRFNVFRDRWRYGGGLVRRIIIFYVEQAHLRV